MTPRPPALAERILDWLLPANHAGESIRGDAWEEFTRRARERSPGAARRWYWIHLLRLAVGYTVPALWREFTEVGMGMGFEFRRAWRGVRRDPLSSGTAVVVLAMGIGLGTFMFSVIFGIFFRGLGLPEEDRVRVVEAVSRESDLITGNMQSFLAEPLLEGLPGAEVAAHGVSSVNLVGPSGPVRLSTTFLTPNAFRLLGMVPALGGLPDVEAGVGEAALLLSHRAWQNEFGGREDIVGMEVWRDGRPATVVGIMPEGFHYPQTQDAWIPVPAEGLVGEGAPVSRLTVLARMTGETEEDQLAAALTARAQGAVAVNPGLPGDLGYRPVTLNERYSGEQMFASLLGMMVAVGLVLLVACANVASLLVARASERVGEVGVRVALGGGRRRVVLPFLLEALLLAAAGAALGVGMAVWGLDLMDTLTSPERTGRPYFVHFVVDLPVLLFTVGISGAAALLAGILPSVKAAAVSPQTVLKDGARGNSAFRLGRLTHLLVVAEVALSTAVLVGAGVTVRSLVELARFDPGFDPAPIMTAQVALVDDDMGMEARQAFPRAYLERLLARPGVDAAVASQLPAMDAFDPRLEVEGVGYAREEDKPRGSVLHVSPGFFRVLGREVLEGRDFRLDEGPGSDPVALVDEPLARRLLPNGDVLGQRVRIAPDEGEEATWYTVVGIVPDVTPQGLDPMADPGGFYLPLLQGEHHFVSVMARTGGADPAMALPALREALREVDPELPLYLAESLPDRMDEGIWFYRIFGSLFLWFGAAALVMVGLGLYAVLSAGVARRRRELGVRMALGADGSRVLGLVSRTAAVQVGAGLTLGLALGWLAGGGIQFLAFHADPRDPLIYAGVVAVVLLVSAGATLQPALRALRVSPVQALRAE